MLCVEQLLEILSDLPDPAFVLTQTGLYVAVFGGADSRYYYDSKHLVGYSVKDVISAEKANWFITQINLALSTNKLLIVEYSLSLDEVTDRRREGRNFIYFEARIQPLHFLINDERAVLWQAININKRHKLEEKLRATSETDPLTGLWNRRYFYSIISQEKKQAIRDDNTISLLLLDIDYFKLVNDQLGHKTGDSVLCEMADLIASCIRDSDVFVRWGGEEFVLLIHHTGMNAAYNLAEKLRCAVEQYQFENALKITVSIGYAQWNFETENIDELIVNADKGLYLAKNGGRNQVKYYMDKSLEIAKIANDKKIIETIKVMDSIC